MAGGVPETVLARAGGLDIKKFWAISNVMPFQIYGSPSMKSLKDGKGKKFAISRFGSLSEFLTPLGAAPGRGRTERRYHGADWRHAGALYHAGWRHGRCDDLWFPVTERAKAAGMNKLFDLKELYPNWTNVGFIARESWLAKEREQATKFLRAYQRGVRHTRGESRTMGFAP